MIRLKAAALQSGDIVLTMTTNVVSKALRVGTNSDISHAMIYVQRASVIDATEEGVHARNTQRLIFDDECSPHVLHLKAGPTPEQMQAVCRFVRQRVGALYNVESEGRQRAADERRGIRQSRAGPLIDELKRWFEATLPKPSGKGESLLAPSAIPSIAGPRSHLSRRRGPRDRQQHCRTRHPRRRAPAPTTAAAAIYTLIETYKLNGIDPQAYLIDVLARLATHPAKQIDALLPWRWQTAQAAIAA